MIFYVGIISQVFLIKIYNKQTKKPRVFPRFLTNRPAIMGTKNILALFFYKKAIIF